jgi:4-amino-4-deoxy-L-arabinose transferase-like glycosyltransferase
MTFEHADGAERSRLQRQADRGFQHYYAGSLPLYVLLSALSDVIRPPFVAGSLALSWGYLRALFCALPRSSPASARQLRRAQWDRLLFKKPKERTEPEFVSEVPAEPGSWIPSLVLLALVLRLAWVLVVPFRPISDPAAYDILARNLAAGIGYGFEPGQLSAYWPVGTSALYGFLYSIFGASEWPVVIANVLLGALATGLTAAMTEGWFGRRAGIIAGLLVAVWPSQIQFASVMASETPFIAALLLGLYVWTREKPGPVTRGVLAGLLFAAASYLRPQALLLPLLLAAAQVVREGRIRHATLLAAPAVLAMMAAILPWSMRNHGVFGRWVIISTNGGSNFWMGNHPGTTGEYEPEPAWTHGLSEVERDKRMGAEAWAYVKAEPVAFVKRTFRKLVKLHDRETIGIAWNPAIVERAGPGAAKGLRIVSTGFWWLALLLGVSGAVFLLIRDGLRPWISSTPVMLWAYFAVSNAVIVVQDRYHFPSIPFIAALAAFALTWKRRDP